MVKVNGAQTDLAVEQEPRRDPAPAAWLPRRLVVVTLSVLLVVLILHLLERFASFLQPLVIAIFLMYVLWPLYRWMVRLGLPSRVASGGLLVGALLALLLLGVVAFWNLDQINPDRLAAYEQHLDNQVNSFLAWLGLTPPEPVSLREFLSSKEGLNVRFKGALVAVSGTLFGFLTASLVVFVYLIFLWLEWSYLPARARKALGRESANDAVSVAEQINDAVGCYMSVLTLVNVIQAGLSVAVLAAFGVDFFFLYGLLIFLMAYIPYIGALVSLALPVIATFVQYPDDPWRGGSVLVLLVAIQVGVENWLYPRLAGDRLNLSPLVVLLALALWGYVWGVVGMFLAIPLTVSLKIILEKVEATRPIAILLSNEGAPKANGGSGGQPQGCSAGR